MKQIIFLIKIILLGYIILELGCKKESESECNTLNNIIGTWRMYNGPESITFTKNFDLIDSLFIGNFATLAQVNKGKFKFLNGFVDFLDIKPSFINTHINPGATGSLQFNYPTYNFEIIDNKLILGETGIYRPEGHNGYEIYGKWQSTRNIIAYDTKQSPIFFSGSQIIEFNFRSDTDTFTVKYLNHYGTIQDSLSDGPFSYKFEMPYIYSYYCDTCSFTLGSLENGILFDTSRGKRDYYKTK
jgi:hypothetical protein